MPATLHPQSPSRPPLRLTLAQLKRGDRASIAMQASESLSEDDRSTLRAMGLDETCSFTVCRSISGGPCIIQIDAMRLGVSPDLARRIITRPCDCADAAHCAAADAVTLAAAKQ